MGNQQCEITGGVFVSPFCDKFVSFSISKQANFYEKVKQIVESI